MNIDHVEIQQLMRQMVDLGIADNLKLWVHSGLVKTRTSGSDLFVPKAYDISGEENDAATLAENQQPKLASDGFLGYNVHGSSGRAQAFDLSNHMPLVGQNSFTAMLWVKINDNTVPENDFGYWLMQERGDSLYNVLPMIYQLIYNKTNSIFRFMIHDGSTSLEVISTTTPTDDTWYHVAATCDDTNEELKIYVNGSLENTEPFPTSYSRTKSCDLCRLMGSWTEVPHLSLIGTANDFRGLTKVLSLTEITAIYNQTKGFYGIT